MGAGTDRAAPPSVGLARVARRAKRVALGAVASSLGAIAAMLAMLSLPAAASKKVCELKREIGVKVDALVVHEQPDLDVAGAMRAPIAIDDAPVPTP